MPYSGGMQETRIERKPADHEVGPAFGPCVGPMTPELGESWFCRGAGSERLNPSEPFALELAVICGPCASMRESKVIEANVMSVIGERAA